MDPKPPPFMLQALGAPTSVARLPSRDPLPRVDEHVVAPETQQEMIRGRRVLAMPARPAHADRHFKLDYVLGAHVRRGYVGATELLTRPSGGSDFATDTCIRREGIDPQTGARHLEELAFEVVNEQSLRDITEKAEDLTARGVRRVFAIFVKTGLVCAWSGATAEAPGAWKELGAGDVIEDPSLSRPIPVQALLDAHLESAADDAVAHALVDKRNPVIEALRNESKAAAILTVLAARGLEVRAEVRARILGCADAATLDRWIGGAAVARSAEDIFG